MIAPVRYQTVATGIQLVLPVGNTSVSMNKIGQPHAADKLQCADPFNGFPDCIRIRIADPGDNIALFIATVHGQAANATKQYLCFLPVLRSNRYDNAADRHE